MLICNEGVESNVSFPVPGSTLISSCVLLYKESVDSNVSFPLPGSTLISSCVCCYVMKVWKVMGVFHCLDLN